MPFLVTRRAARAALTVSVLPEQAPALLMRVSCCAQVGDYMDGTGPQFNAAAGADGKVAAGAHVLSLGR